MFAIACALPLTTAPLCLASPAPVMLANVYHAGVNLDDYWVSEKYDGVRGYWDGVQLLTRGGERVNAPAWFTAGWPTTPLDGELWAGRGQFARAVSTVRQQSPDDAAWRGMRFMVFDLPASPEPFTRRMSALQNVLATLARPWVVRVEQTKVATDAALQAMLRKVVAQGGEGLMLHRGASFYQAVRNDDLLKLKPYEDADAQVLAHVPGQGKFQGKLGALLVATPQGQRFRLGTGFSDAQRTDPPAVGAWVSYRYRGLNASGIPRFASFLRTREDLPALQAP